jgi:hypothetical protein
VLKPAPLLGFIRSPLRTAESRNPKTGAWVRVAPFIYADGTTDPPELLRDVPELNYFSKGIRAVCLSLVAVALVCVLLSALWVFVYRQHSVVIAAQPVFLYVICFGSAMMALCPLVSSYDESNGWDTDKLGRACVANVWLDSLGHMIVYSAIFTKLLRVNRCMRYKTSQIEIWRTIWPCTLLILLVVVILAAWTATGDYRWERSEIDDITGETIGRCNGGVTYVYMFFIYLLHFVPAVLAGIMAYKTTGVDDLYSEAKWVLTFILVQVQVLIVGAPVVFILQDVSPNGRILGYTLLMWTFPMTVVGLIFLPKMLTVRRMQRNAAGSRAGTSSTNPEASSNGDAGARVEATANEHEVTSPRTVRGPKIQIVTFD